MKCNHCHNDIPEEAKCCPHCGAAFDEIKPSKVSKKQPTKELYNEFLDIPFLFGVGAILAGLIGLWIFYLSFIPMGLSIYGLVKTKQARDEGKRSLYALIANFTGLTLGSLGLILLFMVLVASILSGILPSPN